MQTLPHILTIAAISAIWQWRALESFQDNSSLYIDASDISMFFADAVLLLFTKPLIQNIGAGYGAVAASRAADPDDNLVFPFFNIIWK